MKKVVFLLICPALLITLIGNAVALESSFTQTQSASIGFTDSSGTSSTLTQDESGAISGDGTITQDQQRSATVSTNGVVTIGTATVSQVQSVDTTGSGVTPSTYSSASSATPTSNVVSTGTGAIIAGSSEHSTSNVVRIISTPTDVGGTIQGTQSQTVNSGVDVSQQQTGSTMTINTPGRNIGIIHLQQKFRK